MKKFILRILVVSILGAYTPGILIAQFNHVGIKGGINISTTYFTNVEYTNLAGLTNSKIRQDLPWAYLARHPQMRL